MRRVCALAKSREDSPGLESRGEACPPTTKDPTDGARKPGCGCCSALVRTNIAGVEYAELRSIYVKLSGPLSVAYIDIKGQNLATRRLLEERLRR
jgi:hypothetical protein